MPPTPEIKGWCPGAYAPMASEDGLLIRARLVGARIRSEQLAAVARISAQCGNGLVDLSQRAQLQLRGLRKETLADALRHLDAAGLLPRDAAAERVTNIVSSPLAGLDAGAAFDANALAWELAQALQADQTLQALPAKFFFVIDDGGALPLGDIEADIRIEPSEAGFAIRVAGAEQFCVQSGEAVLPALEFARAFVALRGGDAELRRMRRLVGAVGFDALLKQAGLQATPAPIRAAAAARALLGAHETRAGCFAGVAAPSGRWRVEELADLAAFSATEGLAELRVTPWRAFIIPTTSLDDARRIEEATRRLGLIVSSEDPILSVVACPGRPECPQAQGETRTHLARLAPFAQKLAEADGVGLHVSGCAKGCARPKSSAVTLVANKGLFDLVGNGRASDAPQLKGLTIDAVENALIMREKEKPCPTP